MPAAARRTTAAKSTNVTLNLDSVERAPEEIKDPFVAVVNGKRLVFADAADIDWEVLATMESPHDFVEKTLEPGDLEHLYAAKLPGWKFRHLWDAYREYYGLADGRGV